MHVNGSRDSLCSILEIPSGAIVDVDAFPLVSWDWSRLPESSRRRRLSMVHLAKQRDDDGTLVCYACGNKITDFIRCVVIVLWAPDSDKSCGFSFCPDCGALDSFADRLEQVLTPFIRVPHGHA